ncbi:filamentation induced by cAMP protein fic [Candidatus Omnitrophus magneticus]|uniref:Filamentation induced by cAMP protein fic n=1 Tax=Candidatus Omnitrophus magneticus TaxID=1609969 RepID=A0A0F0CR94_9BACT|nr:filamentation induced by cAMP protein fic [Candidatus Omnitrophus magneticus]
MKDILRRVDNAQAKINALRPFSNEMNQQIKEYFRIGLTYSSNALEGNSLTISETKVVIEDGLTIAGKPLREHYEATGHSDAFDYMYTLVTGNTITEEDIKKLHALFYYRIKEEDAGKYRKVQSIITGSQYPLPKPDALPAMLEKFIKDLPCLKKDNHPVVYAAKLHKEFVFIHPFVDGNGRVARLLMNTALMQAGYIIAIIPPLKRAEYISALEKAHKNDADFIKLIASSVYETQNDLLRMVNGKN